MKLLDDFINSLDKNKDNLMDTLHFCQESFGYISEENKDYIAKSLDVKVSKIDEILNFYSYFKTKKDKENKIIVCSGALCQKKGSEKIAKELENLNKNNDFYIENSRCIGACGMGPIVVLNDKPYPKVEVKDLSNILKTE